MNDARPAAPAAAAIDPSAVVEGAKIGRYHLWLCLCCAMVLFVDGYHTMILGFVLPPIAAAWHIPDRLLGPIFSSGLVGLFVGYLVIAPRSGRFGHRRTMISCALAFGATTCLTALVRDAYWLMAARFVTGIGLGGALPVALAMLGEVIPARCRSTAATLVITGLSLGSTFAGVTAVLLLKSLGWKGVLVIGGALPLVVAVVLATTLDETYVYYLQRGDQARARRQLGKIEPKLRSDRDAPLLARGIPPAGVIELFGGSRAGGTLSLWAMVVLNLLVNYALQNWLTTMLIGLRHDQGIAIAATTAINAGGILSGLVVGPLMDRIGSYRVLAAMFGAGAALVWLLGTALTAATWLLLASSFLFGFCSNGLQKGSGALSISFYPIALRPAGAGWMFGIGRLGAAAGPLLVGWLLALRWTPEAVLRAASLPMLAGSATVAVMGLASARRDRAASPR